MPILKDKKTINRLTDLEIVEVSLVDKGAIGEVFTVIKSTNDNQELVNKLEIGKTLEGMTDTEFVAIMQQMLKRYNQINKGGNNMDNEEIKSLIAEVVGATMDIVNKNFVNVNKAIDEIQKKVAELPIDPKEAEKKKKEDEKEDQVAKAVSAIGEAIKGLGVAVDAINKGLDSVTGQVTKIAEMKIDEKITDVNKRLEVIEKQENPSNGIEDVKKSTQDDKPVFWKSFVGTP